MNFLDYYQEKYPSKGLYKGPLPKLMPELFGVKLGTLGTPSFPTPFQHIEEALKKEEKTFIIEGCPHCDHKDTYSDPSKWAKGSGAILQRFGDLGHYLLPFEPCKEHRGLYTEAGGYRILCPACNGIEVSSSYLRDTPHDFTYYLPFCNQHLEGCVNCTEPPFTELLHSEMNRRGLKVGA